MTFAGRALLLCGMVLATTGAAAQPPLPGVLARMRAASGPLWREHVVSSSQAVADGQDVSFRLDSRGLQSFVHECVGALCGGTYFDGTRVYTVNINGTALPRSPAAEPYARGLRIVSGLVFLAPEFTDDGGRIEDLGYASVDGKRERVLQVSDALATPMDVFVDPQTWLVAAVRDVNGDAAMTFHDYRHVGDVVLPFEIDRNGAPAERYASRAISPAPFEAPRGLTPAILGPPQPIATEPQSPTPIVPCSVAGVAVRCLIDTGNSGLSMSLELSERLHERPVGAFEVSGLGRYATEVVRAGPLDVGNLQFPEANYVVLADVHRYGYDVVLGADLLANATVTIDYAQHAVWFAQSSQPASDASSIPLRFENLVPVVPVRLGRADTTLALDTGDESGINLAYGYYREHSDLFKATQEEPVSGVGGTSVELMGEIPDVRIGDFAVESQQVGATRSLRGTADGHLGAGFLRHFRITLDYARSRVIMVPRKNDPAVRLVSVKN